jgi:hypothetical protein
MYAAAGFIYSSTKCQQIRQSNSIEFTEQEVCFLVIDAGRIVMQK